MFSEGPATSQGAESGQTSSGSESSAGGRRPAAGNKLYSIILNLIKEYSQNSLLNKVKNLLSGYFYYVIEFMDFSLLHFQMMRTLSNENVLTFVISLTYLLLDDLSELSQNPQFQALRTLIQQNPDQLQTLMQTLQASQPELYRVMIIFNFCMFYDLFSFS